MALRTVQGNIVGVPTDCPTREKCGWLGDSHAYIKMAMVGYDMDNFLYKYMDDICSGAARFEPNTLHHKYKNRYFYFTDKASGIPYMIAPGKRLCGVASPDWGTAIVQLPWHMYLYDGDVDALVKYYASMA
jgi:alpha-L-rhamnosidase